MNEFYTQSEIERMTEEEFLSTFAALSEWFKEDDDHDRLTE